MRLRLPTGGVLRHLRDGPRGSDLLVRAAQVFALAGFAVCQPLLDLLGDQADFFVAHRSRALDLVALALALGLVVPSLLVALEVAAEVLSAAAGRAFHTALVALLATLAALPAWGKLGGAPGVLIVALAAISGGAVAGAERRLGWMRTFLAFLAPAVPVFVAHFLFATPVRQLLIRSPAADS